MTYAAQRRVPARVVVDAERDPARGVGFVALAFCSAREKAVSYCRFDGDEMSGEAALKFSIVQVQPSTIMSATPVWTAAASAGAAKAVRAEAASAARTGLSFMVMEVLYCRAVGE